MSYEFRSFRGQRPLRRPSGRLQPEMKLEELAARWAKARKHSPKTVHALGIAVKEFLALMGNLSIGKIAHEHMFDFRDRLSLLPVARHRSERTLNLYVLIERYKGGEDDRPRLVATTVGKKVNAIQALIGFAYRERWIDIDDVHNIPLRKTPLVGRRSFTRQEIAKQFKLPLFVRPWDLPERRHQVSDFTVRWLFFLAMMTGARIEELCQLTIQDIAEIEGVWRIAITDCDDDGPTIEKHLKSNSQRRMVAVHHRLIDIGLLRLVERRRQSGELRLFPDLRRDPFGRLSGVASQRCNHVIDKISRDPRLCFHSFRHFFKTHCRSATLQDSTNDQLTGHAPPTIGRRYGEGVELSVLAAAMDKLDFECLEWEPILRAVRM